MSQAPRRKHREVIEEFLALKGKRVADIGCGDGSLVRLMTRLGARVTGIEPSAGQIARARAAEPAGDEDYLQAGAEELPLPDASLDIAVFFNALHHVPVALMEKALQEAARALKPGGLLYIQEPIAGGPNFQATRLIDDETEVRAKAYEALQAAAQGTLFEAEREYTYFAPIRHDSFERFRDHMIAVDERRRPKVEALEAELRAAFEANAVRHDDGFEFDQPCRLNLLRRI
jgi:SAM-dependent methyltransferase